jgi:membrane carboxypeptidase/penicillin-binding protein
MRRLLKIALSLAGTLILILLLASSWFYFYSRDLPDVTTIGEYTPTTVTEVFNPCIGTSMAVPYEALGSNVSNAIRAVETKESDPGVLRALWIQLFEKGGYFGIEGSGRRTLNASIYIARSLCYPPLMQSKRTLAELRTAIQLERRYSDSYSQLLRIGCISGPT